MDARSSLGRHLDGSGRRYDWIARQLGVSKSAVSHWCTDPQRPDYRRPNAARRAWFCDLLGVPEAELFPDGEEVTR